MPRINYTSEEKSGSKFVLKPGEYPVCFTDYQWGKSKGGKTAGADIVKLKLEVQGVEGEIWVYDNLIFAESTSWKVSAFLRCFGVIFDEGADIDVNDELLDSMIGRQGRIEIKNEVYNNKTYNRLESYLSAEQAQAQAATPAGESLEFDENNIPF